MNRSKDLRLLFRESLVNARKCAAKCYSPSSNFVGGVHRIPNQYNDIRIYFYEWSDVSRTPRVFYQLDIFDNFLMSSGIYMALYQKDIIRNLGSVYVTCYTGTKTLSIRSSYSSLCDALHEHDGKHLLPSIHRPNIVYEPNSRYPEASDMYFG